MRERLRDQMREDVKRVALRQLAEGGPQAVSVNAIAKELGVSGPALYRYFAGRDELLTELIADAYHDLAAALAEAVRLARRRRPGGRLRALAGAYRAWARAQPHRYRLLFAAPLPGYDAHAARLVDASQEAMDVLLDALRAVPAPVSTVHGGGRLGEQLARWAAARQREGLDPSVALRAVVLWSRLHGLVGLEIEGNFASMGIDPDLLFEAEVAALLPADATEPI